MPLASLCPEPHVLQRLLLGQIPPADAPPVAEHLSHCERCAGTLHSLQGEDTLVEALRAGAAAGDDPESGVIQELIHRLERLHSSRTSAESSAAPPPATPTSGEATLAAQAPSAEEATERAYDFLAPPQAPGELGRLGPYRVLTVLGAGGMGVVFQAEDTHLERLVALKAMLPALASNASARQRFLREARAAASIEHDHIVPIFQVGEDRGTPFLAMPLLKGEPLDERLKRENKLPVAMVLRIGREVAEGLAAAHERGLIHRDVKPGNIWLEGARAHIKILDFGLARAAADTAHLTQSGAIVGTPAYMAPEQTRGGTVDQRADLFSLGCVLYRLATGEPPFKGADTMSILTSLALDNPPPPRELDPGIPAALSDLVMRLLAKKPEDRPQSAQIVVGAIQAVERDQADPAGRRDDQGKTMAFESPAAAPSGRSRPRPSGRRWILAAVVVALGLLGVGGYLSAPTVYRIITDQGELVIETVEPDVEVTVKQGGEVVKIVDPKTQHEILLKAGAYRVELPKGGDFILSTDHFTLQRNGQVIVKVTLNPPPKPGFTEAVNGKPLPAAVQKPQAAAGPVPLDALRREQIPAYELAMAGDGDPARTAGLVAVLGDSRLKHWRGVNAVAFSPDGKTLASGSGDQTVKLWDPDTGKELQTLNVKDRVRCLAISPDGKTLASAGESENITLWDPAGGKELRTLSGLHGQIFSVAFRGDGQMLACGAADGVVILWDAGAWKEHAALTGHKGEVRSVAFSPDGKTLASGGADGAVRLWDVDGKEPRTLGEHKGGVFGVAFSPDGKTLASGGADGAVRLWDVDGGKERRTLAGQKVNAFSVAFSPEGKTLASADNGGTIRLWDLTADKEPRLLTGHRHEAFSVAFSPDGKTLASGGFDHTVRLWEADTGKERFPSAGKTCWVSSVAFSPDGKVLASGCGDATANLWDAATGKELHSLSGHHWFVSSLAFSPDGKMLATGSGDNTVKVWDRESGKELFTLTEHRLLVTSVAFSPDGKTLASGSWDKTVKLWQVDRGQEIHTLQGHQGWVSSVAFSPDGKTLASGSWDKTVKLWETDTGKERDTRTGFQDPVSSVAFSPDGRLGAAGTGSTDCLIRLWQTATGRPTPFLKGHQGPVDSVAFRPDGGVLASASGDGTVRLWDTATGAEKASFRLCPEGGLNGWQGLINQAAFSPDGRYLATANGNGTVYILRLAPPPLVEKKVGQVRPFAGHTEAVNGVAFSGDGRRAVSSSRDGTVRLWDVDSGKEVRQFESGSAVSATIIPDGRRVLSGSDDKTVRIWALPETGPEK